MVVFLLVKRNGICIFRDKTWNLSGYFHKNHFLNIFGFQEISAFCFFDWLAFGHLKERLFSPQSVRRLRGGGDANDEGKRASKSILGGGWGGGGKCFYSLWWDEEGGADEFEIWGTFKKLRPISAVLLFNASFLISTYLGGSHKRELSNEGNR
jgi:hypothetical protein